MTLEKELGLSKNEFEIPDFENIEIKTKKINSNYYTTLFNANPKGPGFSEVIRIKNIYGWPDSIYKNKNIFNASINANQTSLIGKKWKMILTLNDKEKKVFLIIKNTNNKIIENKIYWTYKLLQEKLYRKLSLLAFIEYSKKEINNVNYFNYQKISFYRLITFKNFLELLKTGEIRISFKVGIYKYGIKKGQTFDHGTGFEIKKESLEKLFRKIKI